MARALCSIKTILIFPTNTWWTSVEIIRSIRRTASIPSVYVYSSYGRNDNGFIRDDHRVNGLSRNGTKPLTPTRNGKATKSPRHKGPPKRRNSRQRKQRNQNSKSEGKNKIIRLKTYFYRIFHLGTPSTNTHELKSSTESELTDSDKHKYEAKTSEDKPLPPRTTEHHDEQHKSE